jgi:hypothetical protein
MLANCPVYFNEIDLMTLVYKQLRLNAQNVIDFLFMFIWIISLMCKMNDKMIKFDVFHLPLVFPQESAAILFPRMHCGYTIPF